MKILEGKEVYVIGREKKEDSVNQVWFETENYNLGTNDQIRKQSKRRSAV